MSQTDPIADFLTAIRNASARRKESFDTPASNMKLGIARILKDEGYIRHFKYQKDEKQGILRLYLRYSPTGERVISEIKRVSSPGCRRYVGVDQIPFVLGGLGVSIMSTSKGLMTGKQAKKNNVGGELVAVLY